jgi:hypothetical protein
MRETVFFGPFFGELGWEFAYWHGWVKKMCREKYQSYRKITASYPGREPFYSETDEFWPHPTEINNLKISQRAYVTDCWMGNLPKPNNPAGIDKDISQYAENLLNGYREILPKDTIFYVPHKLNSYCLDGRQYFIGTLFLRGLSLYRRPKSFPAPLEHQVFENLKPTKDGKEFLNKLVNSEQRIIAVFPRYRKSRRSDKSWPKEKYHLLIEYLKKKYPKHLIGIFGAPGGCYYSEGVPQNCLDLINLPDDLRFNVQIAALERSDLAIGSESGGIHNALLVSCPTIEWGWAINHKIVEGLNFLGTRFVFWPQVNPSIETIKNIIDLMAQNRERELIYPKPSKEDWHQVNKTPFLIRQLDSIRTVGVESLAKQLVTYLRFKKSKEGIINNLILTQ